MATKTVTVDVEVDVDLEDFQDHEIEHEYLERFHDSAHDMHGLGEELYMAMAAGDRARQDNVCRTIVYELAGRII